ncbi:MAG: cytochrome b [Gammaproteobacteria bacterium]|nr:cytochrome b [Gammaproteobacteria bacterium]
MQWKNGKTGYGWFSILLHWAVALLVFGLFGLGLWMVDLGYYDAWYQRAPWWHKGLGVTMLALVLVRLAWRRANPVPRPMAGHAAWEVRLSRAVHRLFYLLLLLLALTGYLMVTAAGDGLEVFDWFVIPATLSDVDGQEDLAGDLHRWLAWTTVGLAGLHAAGALKHHLLDRDATLKRMLRPGPDVT